VDALQWCEVSLNNVSHFHALSDMSDADVLVDHARWITRLREHVYGSLRLDPATVGRADSCAFASWLRNAEPQMRHFDYWRCIALHVRWHDCAARVVDLANHGRRLEAELAMAPGGQLRCLSSELVTTFARLRQDGLEGDARDVLAHDLGVCGLEP
jgi:hypothetical protein